MFWAVWRNLRKSFHPSDLATERASERAGDNRDIVIERRPSPSSEPASLSVPRSRATHPDCEMKFLEIENVSRNCGERQNKRFERLHVWNKSPNYVAPSVAVTDSSRRRRRRRRRWRWHSAATTTTLTAVAARSQRNLLRQLTRLFLLSEAFGSLSILAMSVFA